MDKQWATLYQAAKAAQRPRQISPCVEAGGVAAAILSEGGAIYTGVCVDTCCSLGVCAERSVIFRMLTDGESRIRRVLVMMPEEYGGIELLVDSGAGRQVVTLGELTPAWWL